MDKKTEACYNLNYSTKKDNLRNELPFQNMLNYPNNIFQFGPMPNIVFVDTNFLNKKRESKDSNQIDMIQFQEKTKCKYLIPINIIYFILEILIDKYLNQYFQYNKYIIFKTHFKTTYYLIYYSNKQMR
jgi:hypothetical protein